VNYFRCRLKRGRKDNGINSVNALSLSLSLAPPPTTRLPASWLRLSRSPFPTSWRGIVGDAQCPRLSADLFIAAFQPPPPRRPVLLREVPLHPGVRLIGGPGEGRQRSALPYHRPSKKLAINGPAPEVYGPFVAVSKYCRIAGPCSTALYAQLLRPFGRGCPYNAAARGPSLHFPPRLHPSRGSKVLGLES
jgi:hypothetical protein